MMELATGLSVVAALAVAAYLTGRAAARGERRALETLARNFGIDPTGLTDAQVEHRINKLFWGWRTR